MSYYDHSVPNPTSFPQALRPAGTPPPSMMSGDVGMSATRRWRLMLRRGFGGLLLLIWIAVAFSVLTWSVSDPSLTHAASGAVRNKMGPLGAIVSDLLVQTLGVASIIAILPPLYWSILLATQGRVPRAKTKIVCLPVGVLGLALALSSLPVLSSWSLKYGYGGMFGDLLLGRAVSLLSVINSSRAGIAAGIFGLAVGLAALQRSFGLSTADLIDLAEPLKQKLGRRVEPTASPVASQPPSLDANSYETHAAGASIQPQPAAPVHDMSYRPSLAQNLPPPLPQRQAAPYVQPHAPLPPLQGWTEPVPTSSAPQFTAAPASMYPEPTAAQAPVLPMSAPRLGMSQPMFRSAPPPPNAVPAARVTPDVHSEHIARRFAHRLPIAADEIPQQDAPQLPPREPEIVMPEVVQQHSGRARGIAPGGFFDRLAGNLRKHESLAQGYKRPSLNLLKQVAPSRGNEAHDKAKLKERSQLLVDTLNDFGVSGTITAVRPGPVVTLFEFEPARGTKSSRVIGLADDIARSMSARAVRIAVVPGVNALGIELPNATRDAVGFRDILESEALRKSDAKLPLALGKGIGGEAIVADLARMPHLLVAGTTGAGKSVGVNAMILSLLYQLPPEECRLILIDPKMLELSVYKDIPHLLTPVVTDPNKALAALNWAVGEMERRYKCMSDMSVRSIEVYNNRVRNSKRHDDLRGGKGNVGTASPDGDPAPMPYIVIVVDEFADLMAVAGKEIEFAVQRLAQMARAAGIHLIMATQRPSVDVVTGTIKANFPSRISFRVTSRIDSRTILNEQGAEQLLGQGDMLYATGAGQIVRVHGPFVSDEEVEQIASYLRTLGQPAYVDGVTDTPDPEASRGEPQPIDEDELYDRAVALVRTEHKASISYLQRKLGIGYNRAASIIERMQDDGLVSAPNAAGKRELVAEAAPSHAAEAPQADAVVQNFTRGG